MQRTDPEQYADLPGGDNLAHHFLLLGPAV